ncbi:IS1595 family transposase [Pseudoxanthomonas sp. PXM03]|uniref:IS1595 family transposase n=1 Tax=Pseudoxanthomonas sp. PXM03 TaxID=2769284 RepID=UPI00177B99C4|nr:IS1595 family transposase [Pseudoxanthomonas sp. PXM03]MBD9435754.1 IS1595 family transposase [Pseudoxanthomonas sp. PXM03]
MAKKKNHLQSKEAHNYAGLCLDMTEYEAEALFAQVRWGSTTEQGCPGTDCGSFRSHYRLQAKRRWRCVDCGHEFSATSRTAFHGRKLSYRRLLGLLVFFECGAKGQSIAEASRMFGVQIKTMLANMGKIRETLINKMDLTPLSGLIHMDGIHLGGKPRKSNHRGKMTSEVMKAKLTKGKRAKHFMSRKNLERRKNRRVVLSLCLAGEAGEGSIRTMAFVTHSENEQNVMTLASHFVAPHSMIWSDENAAYGGLQGTTIEHYAVPHALMFCTSDGVNNNLAEAWNSRIRRYEYGVGHGFRPKYMQDYVCEMVWRENNRRQCQKTKIQDLLKGMMGSPPSRWWKGYFQGNHRDGELTLEYFLQRAAKAAQSAA